MKRLVYLAAFVVLFVFVSNASAQVLAGSYKADISSNGYTLDKNTGDRYFSMYVKFDKGFDKMPTVIVTVNKLDANKETNTRFEVQTEAISRDGFTIKIKTWADSKIYGIGGDWIAVQLP